MLSTLALPTMAAQWGGPWAGGFGFLWLLVPVFWFALLLFGFWLIGRRWRHSRWQGARPYGHPGGWGSAVRSAESTLAERFAQGDIDEKEYRARLEVLRANNPDGPAGD